ncbi:MAG: FAD-dependent oxidoreductase, partial [Methanomassiliicoccales archaeon]|nr:FAD-dependent oxidoreductase [Methanomassiliicoccales archaeon]
MTAESDRTGRIGVYLCSESGEIGSRIDLENVAEFMRQFDDVVEVGIHTELSSKDGIDYLISRYYEAKFDRIVIGGAIPNIQGVVLRNALSAAGMNKYLFEMVNLREQCAWVHPDKKEATENAKSLMLGGLARVRRLKPLDDITVPIRDAALVIGGGVAGMAAALEIANAGHKVYIVEREKNLGGRTYSLGTTFPTHNCGICCMQYCKECVFTPKIEDVLRNANIEVLLGTEVKEITGGFGNRHVKIVQDREEKELDVGIIVVATGSRTFDPERIPAYAYGQSKDVMTSMEFIDIMRDADVTGVRRPSDGSRPKVVNFVLCVGSRDATNGNPHCSLVCCTYAIGIAKELKKLHPDTDVYIHYIDLRGPYRGFEEFYAEAMEMGIKFVRGRVAEVVPENGKLIVRAEDTDAGVVLNIESDLVVLAVGQEPSDGADKIAKMLHIQTDLDQFMKDVNPMLPTESRRGIYIAGCAQGPKGIRYSVDDAKTVAQDIVAVMDSGKISIER